MRSISSFTKWGTLPTNVPHCPSRSSIILACGEFISEPNTSATLAQMYDVLETVSLSQNTAIYVASGLPSCSNSSSKSSGVALLAHRWSIDISRRWWSFIWAIESYVQSVLLHSFCCPRPKSTTAYRYKASVQKNFGHWPDTISVYIWTRLSNAPNQSWQSSWA